MFDNSGQGYRGRGSNGSRGRGSGRGRSQGPAYSGRGAPQDSGQGLKVCTYHTRSRTCQFGDGCRFSHSLSASYLVKAHDNPISAAGVLPTPFRILSGSRELGIKVWNFDGDTPREEVKIATKGPVQKIEVVQNTILWSEQENLIPDIADSSVGIVNFLIDPSNLNSIPIKRSDTIPYTHPVEVGYFTTALANGVLYVITGGGDSTIRTWQYDQNKNSFDHLVVLEGHVRGITALLVADSKLWSASMDTTVRIWDIPSGRCDSVLSKPNNGHTAPVCCLKQIPAFPPSNTAFIASGACDGAVKIWSMTGSHVFSLMLGDGIFVTALEVFADELGGHPMMIAGLSDGRLNIISCRSMTVLLQIDSSIFATQAVNVILSLGGSKFLTGGDDGQLIIWQVDKPLLDTQ